MVFDREKFYCTIVEDECIMDVVGEFNWEPAVLRQSSEEPDETYISICEFFPDFTGKCNDIGSQTFDVKIVWARCCKKEEVIRKFEIFHILITKIQMDWVFEVVKEDLNNRVLKDPQTNRYYISTVYTIKFVY